MGTQSRYPACGHGLDSTLNHRAARSQSHRLPQPHLASTSPSTRARTSSASVVPDRSWCLQAAKELEAAEKAKKEAKKEATTKAAAETEGKKEAEGSKLTKTSSSPKQGPKIGDAPKAETGKGPDQVAPEGNDDDESTPRDADGNELAVDLDTSKLTAAQLQEELTKRGLDVKWQPLKGKKVLVERLQVTPPFPLHCHSHLPDFLTCLKCSLLCLLTGLTPSLFGLPFILFLIKRQDLFSLCPHPSMHLNCSLITLLTCIAQSNHQDTACVVQDDDSMSLAGCL